jgi:hypothetical protein
VDARDVKLLLDKVAQLGVEHRKRLTGGMLLQELLQAWEVRAKRPVRSGSQDLTAAHTVVADDT